MAGPKDPAEETTMGKLIQYLDIFHNSQPKRTPSKTGCCLTFSMFPVVLIYALIWVVVYLQKPPSETFDINWAMSSGPFPLTVRCSSSCWLYLSGCTSNSSDQCLALQANEERRLEFCYATNYSEGLHVWWPATSEGLTITSEAQMKQMVQPIHPGRSMLTYVKTKDKTQKTGSYQYLRHEWFLMYLSPEFGFNRTLMDVGQSDSKTLQKKTFIVSLIGELGGAYEIISLVFTVLYILLWRLQHFTKPTDYELEETSESEGSSRAV